MWYFDLSIQCQTPQKYLKFAKLLNDFYSNIWNFETYLSARLLKVHTANELLQCCHERDIEILKFRAKCPHLELIEKVWGELKVQLKRSYKEAQELL